MELLKAGALAIAFTVLIALIEINWRSKAPLALACRSNEFVIFLLVLIVGNTATTMASGGIGLYMAAEQSSAAAEDGRLPGAAWFWYAFVGVFGFEVILQNLNVTVANQGVFTINDWISKARDKAVARAIERQTHADAEQAQALAGKLQQLRSEDLNAHLLKVVGAEALRAIEASAKATNSNVQLAKALTLAYEAPVEAAAIAQHVS